MFVAPFTALACTLAPAPDTSDLLAGLPKDCFAAIETEHLSDWLEDGLDQPWLHRVRSLPPVKDALSNAPMQPEAALALGSFFLGQPILPALADISDGGIAFGFGLDGKRVVPYTILDSNDADGLDAFLKLLSRKVESSQNMPIGALWNSSEEFHGARVWSVGVDIALGARADRLYISENKKQVKRMLLADREETTIASTKSWPKIQSMMNAQAKVRLWLDLDRLENRVAKSDLRDLRRMASQPEVHFLFGSNFAQIGSAQMMMLELWGDDDQLTLSTNSISSADTEHATLHPSSPPTAGLPKERPGEVLRAQVFRNLDGLFEHRVDLFPPRSQPPFAEFAATLSLFLSGEDPEEALLPHLSPWFGIIARPVALDPAPDLSLPAVCVIAQMNNPETLGPQLTAAFQTAVGLANVDSAQKRLPSLLLKLEQFEGIPLTYAEYLAPREGAGVDARYNLVPACAVVRDRFLIGTHADLVRDVARQIQRGQLDKTGLPEDFLEVNGTSVQAALKNNIDALVLNAVLSRGLSTEKAQEQIADIVNLVGQVDTLSTKLWSKTNGLTNLTIDLQMLPWKLK